jgi:hypothetical protein
MVLLFLSLADIRIFEGHLSQSFDVATVLTPQPAILLLMATDVPATAPACLDTTQSIPEDPLSLLPDIIVLRSF